MSRLYARTHSDRRKTDATAGANEVVKSNHYWGSANDSHQAVSVITTWHRSKDKPTVTVVLGYGVNYQVLDVSGKVLTQLN